MAIDITADSESSISGTTLEYTFLSLVQDVGEYYYDARTTTGDNLSDCKRIVNSGYLDFLRQYDWNFLKPSTTISLWPTTGGTMAVTSLYTVTDSTNSPFVPSMLGHTIVSTNGSYVISAYTSSSVVTVSSDASADDGEAFTITPTGDYPLPADFGAMLSDRMVYPANTGQPSIREATPEWIRARRAAGQATGYARYYAIEPAALTAVGQRWNLLVWPTPGTLKAVHYRYKVLVDSMTDDAEYPIGGPLHAPAVQAWALRQAEMEKTHSRGPMHEAAMEALAASIRIDKDQRPRVLGRVTDPGTRVGQAHDPNDWQTQVTIS